MTWFWLHLRNGKDQLVEGEAERDRRLKRKTPKAIGYTTALNHRCSVCEHAGPWTDDWCWFGSWQDLDEARPITKFCSPACRATFSEKTPTAERPRYRMNYEPLTPDRMQQKRERAALASQAMHGHRKFEMPVWPKDRYGPGWCRWCGEDILEFRGKRAGQRSRRRTWHHHKYFDRRNCFREFLEHTDRDVQARELMKRDGTGCAICGKGDGKWVGSLLFIQPLNEAGQSRIWWSVPLEVDHVIPLWRSDEFTDPDERRALHGLDNLWLLCLDHHRWKSAQEAAERAAR